MAKTLMVSDDVYNELKTIKENQNKSFSEVIKDLIKTKSHNGNALKKFLGVLQKDNEYSMIMKKLKRKWA